MFRGETTKAGFALLIATLIALQCFAFTGNFASAHTLGEAKARTTTGFVLSGQPPGGGADMLREADCSPSPAGFAHARNRHRATDSAQVQERPHISRQPATARPPAASGAPHRRDTRSVRVPAPAALQVFRC
ncbi:hypothetical protein OIB37_28480 [Streptomyces sp. NBC_00820]|uniref:hypothetical protein n=1 Tax=Streptomyces sp. NBC_00820 TaxID=2975842 RepID=UPI002ED27B51|nr:hypothetical protein OIB37_28480 [Streptomyces sp. NBC_00820]